MVDAEYGYANARIKAMKTKLFDVDKMRDLSTVKTLPEVIELLEESVYKKEFVDASTKHSGMDLVLVALKSDLLSCVNRLFKYAPSKSHAILYAQLRNWEVNDLKQIIISKALSKPVDAKQFVGVNEESADFVQKIASMDSIKDIARELMDSPYSQSVEPVLSKIIRSNDFKLLCEALDKSYYRQLNQAAQEFGDAQTKKFLDFWFDSLNAILVARMVFSNTSAKEIYPYLIEGGNYSFYSSLAEEKDKAKLLNSIKDKFDLTASLIEKVSKTNELSWLELALERKTAEKAKKILSTSVLSPAVAVCFLYLKHQEIHSLRRLAFATEFDYGDELRQTIVVAG